MNVAPQRFHRRTNGWLFADDKREPIQDSKARSLRKLEAEIIDAGRGGGGVHEAEDGVIGNPDVWITQRSRRQANAFQHFARSIPTLRATFS
jgi:hypothetical protein